MPFDYYLGLDPGFTGYISVLDPAGNLVEFFKTPVIKTVKKTKHRTGKRAGKISTKTKQVLDEKAIKAFLLKYRRRDGARVRSVITVEQQHAMSYEGRASIAKTMYGFGFWCGLARGIGLTLRVIRAVEWQNYFWTTTKEERKADKDISKKRSVNCIKEWNKEIDLRKTKRSKKDDHNLADALNIGRYSWIKNHKADGDTDGEK